MRRLLVVLFIALPAFGGSLELGIRHVITNVSSDTGALEIESGRGFGAVAEWFWNDSLSTQASVTLINPAASIDGTDLGTLGMSTYAATARWHIAPRARISGYAGGGVAFVKFGDLDDQFGDAIDVQLGDETAFLGEAGLRWHARPHVYLDLGGTYMPLEAKPEIGRSNVAFPTSVTLDPWTVGVSASWRF